MTVQPLGIHHVTAIATDPQRNVDFYASVLGLRLVKRTVNFDAPDTYHLYYGDDAGNPGTLLTFFPWPGTPRGRRGAGQATSTAFSVPEASLGWWKARLERMAVEPIAATTRLEEDVLRFADPDGLVLELVTHPGGDPRPPRAGGVVPREHAVRGLHSVTMTEVDLDRTAGLIAGTLSFSVVAEEGDRTRFAVGDGGPGSLVDVVADPSAPEGLVAGGTVHHVAWRAPDESTEARWREEIVDDGHRVTPIIDRQYFRSIYFREPGGVLLEIATDPPGFTTDEPLLELGRKLQLPPWLEPRREEIERYLPALKLPDEEVDGLRDEGGA